MEKRHNSYDVCSSLAFYPTLRFGVEAHFRVGEAFYIYKTSLILGEVDHGIYPELTVKLVFTESQIMNNNKVERVFVVSKSGKPLMPTKRLGMVSRVYNREKRKFFATSRLRFSCYTRRLSTHKM